MKRYNAYKYFYLFGTALIILTTAVISRANVDSAALLNVPALVDPPPDGYGLSGAGIRVGIFDYKYVDPNHPDLSGRVIRIETPNPERADEMRVGDHPTHGAGTVASSGEGDADAKGFAPEAEIYSFGPTQDYLFDRYLSDIFNDEEIWVTNSSHGWGFEDQEYAEYGPKEEDIDWTVILSDTAMVWGSGNEGWPVPGESYTDGGWKSIRDGSLSKNTFSVAGCYINDYLRRGFYEIWWSSSKGPTLDGRLKPEFVALYKVYSLWDTISQPDDPYGTKQGTSQAAPALAGAIALLYEHYWNLYGDRMPLALLRAALVHTADDLNEENTVGFNLSAHFDNISVELDQDQIPKAGPDFISGWGAPDIEAAAELLSNPERWRRDGMRRNLYREYAIQHEGGPLKVTVAWKDPMDNGMTVMMPLVNDLDLEVFAPDGTVHRPWVLDPDNPNDPATTGINTVDVQEQVYISDASEGRWKIRVTATRVGLAGDIASYAIVADSELIPLYPPDVNDAIIHLVATMML